MEAIFLSLLNMSITATWIALAVIVFRLFLKKSPKYIRVILWGLVAVRLICPISIESIFSLVPSAQTIPSDFAYSSAPTIESNILIIDTAAAYAIENMFTPDPTNSVNPLQVITFVASIVWIVGMCIMLLYSLISYLRIKRKVSTSINIKENIYICDEITTPFIFGLLKPRIYIPSTTNEYDIQYIIAHEKAHLKRLDHIWKPLGFLLLTIYWFNPVLWIAYTLLCRDIEFACDEKVIKEMGAEIKVPYSDALVNCSISHKMLLACPLAFGEVGVKQRIKSVLNYKKPAFWVLIIVVILSIIIGICFMTNPKINDISENNPKLNEAISEAILDINKSKFKQGECVSEGHIVYGIEEYGNKLKVYLHELYYEFGFEDGYFMAQSGHCCPGVYIFNKNGNAYSFVKAEYPEDGEGYGDSIRMLFPKKYVERALNPNLKEERDMWEQCEAYAEQYLKEIGRKAEVVTYGDIKHILFTDLGVSVDVSNKILGLGLPYKSEIGNYEQIEGGVRYIYNTAFLQDKNIILFTKEIYDTKEIVERIEVDSKAGCVTTVESKPAKSSYFDAEILQVTNDTILVKPFDNTKERACSDKIWVSTKTSSAVPPPDLYEGLNIRIVYDGMIQETYPAQIRNVFAIYLYADVNYRGEDIEKGEPTTKSVVVD